MTLDLRDVVADWDCTTGEICARIVVGRDGQELVQLRIDLGLMQMAPDGRPDGRRYRGLPTALDFIRRELRLPAGAITAQDWRELERELYQINYRRLALSSMIEECLARDDGQAAGRHLERALRDIDECLERIRAAAEDPTRRDGPWPGSGLQPTLVFHRGRLRVQRCVLREAPEEAVEEAVRGGAELESLLADLGFEAEQRAADPGVQFLRNLGRRLRREYGITQTLSERLEQAIEDEDFETAGRLRDELRRRASRAGSSDEPPGGYAGP